MKFKLELNNTTKEKFKKKFFEGIFHETISLSGIECLQEKRSVEISVALVDEDEIQKLNSQYRKKNKPTDVLSFCEYEKTESICEITSKDVFLGELIICPVYIKKVSEQESEPLEYSMKYIVAHGILHLLGFDHGKRMFKLQGKVAENIAG